MSLTERAAKIQADIADNLSHPITRREESTGNLVPIHGSTWKGTIGVPVNGSMVDVVVYLRDTFYLARTSYDEQHKHQWCRALMLANIASKAPGSGIMADMLAALEAEAAYRGCTLLKLENFQNLRLYDFCKTQGYTLEPGNPKGLRSLVKTITPLTNSATAPEDVS